MSISSIGRLIDIVYINVWSSIHRLAYQRAKESGVAKNVCVTKGAYAGVRNTV
jgi:hypothetical protein